MKKVTMTLSNIGGTAVATVHDTFVDEGCLWMYLDAEGDHVKVIPLHILLSFDIESIREST